MGFFKAKASYGNPRIAVSHVPNPGEIVTVYRQKKDLKFGDVVTISPPGYDMPGIVVGTSADDPRYQNRVLCGVKTVNLGEGYYQIKVMEIPK